LTEDRRSYADPETAARRIIEIANAIEPVQGASTSRRSTDCSQKSENGTGAIIDMQHAEGRN
jgi:hypothetical protein